MRRTLLALLALSGCATVGGPQSGRGRAEVMLDGQPIEVLTYRPEACKPRGVLLVFHGQARNAATYRDDAVPLAERDCLFVAAPLFDRARFATWQYQRGGIAHDGAVLPPAQWTAAVLPALVGWARTQAGGAALPYEMIGHSAGAQFLSRVMAFGGEGAARAVIANPSSWVAPSLAIRAPYGFAGVPAPQGGEAGLRRYVGAPVTVLLGGADTGSRYLAETHEAKAQGPTRLARGTNIFNEARDLAQTHGWPFGWSLEIVPGVGHDARAMLGSEQASASLVIGSGSGGSAARPAGPSQEVPRATR